MAFCSLFLLDRPLPGAFAAGARARRREWGSIGRFHRLMQAPTGATVALRRSGGTGRRAGLKIRCLHGRVGSSPTFGIARAKAGAFARIRGWSLRGKRARAEPARLLGAWRLFSSVRREQASRARVAPVRLRVGRLRPSYAPAWVEAELPGSDPWV